MEKIEVKEAKGKLGILVVGVGGAVATTMITGTLAARKGLAKPIGSISQLATMRLENGEEKAIKDIVPLTDLNDIVFGGWDIFPDNAYEAALFRLFDIFKPLGIRKMEYLKGGVGVMMDDILAGIYSLILLIVARWLIG